MSGGIMIGFPEMLGIIAALLVGILIYRRPHSIRTRSSLPALRRNSI
jgi:hypothetical protein